jgi:hypothetical protein
MSFFKNDILQNINVMSKCLSISFLMIVLIYSGSNAQCFSRNGIMNEPCKSMTILTPPAFEVGVGLSNAHIFKVDVNYITKNEIVYGGSFGARLSKSKIPVINQEDMTFNAFLGYNLIGCIIIGVTAGVTHYTNIHIQDDRPLKTSEFNKDIGMSIKVITNYASFPITFGCYGSKARIGMTIGTIF